LLVAGENFALGAQPILAVLARLAPTLLINLVRTAADLVFQIDRNNVFLYLDCDLQLGAVTVLL